MSVATDHKALADTIAANLSHLEAEELLALARLTTALARIREKRARIYAGALSKLWGVTDVFECAASSAPDLRGSK